MKKILLICLWLAMSGVVRADQAPVIDVWPGAAPGDTRNIPEEKPETKGGITRIGNVSHPTLTIYRPDKDKDNGSAIIICPGGGYSILAWDLEGTEVAQRLNQAGITGIVLKYRVPVARTVQTKDFMPLMDAQRAISLVRSKAGEWNIDADRIGILGFSAGGNLAALACTNFAQRTYDAIDDVDKVSDRPDFGVLVYPAYLLVDKAETLSPNLPVSSQTPPIFFVHADNDHLSSAGSIMLYLALKHAGVPAELHIYTQGGHGFGLRKSEHPAYTWPDRLEEWLKSQGYLKSHHDAQK